ncbi:MAG: hypothetical protein WCH79_18055 [Planctomycetia bacterium]
MPFAPVLHHLVGLLASLILFTTGAALADESGEPKAVLQAVSANRIGRGKWTFFDIFPLLPPVQGLLTEVLRLLAAMI